MQSEKSKKIGVKSASTNIPVVVHTSLTKRSKSSNQETLYRSPQKSLSIPQDTLYKAPLVAQSPQSSEVIPQETLYKSPQGSLSIPQDTLYQAPLVAQSPQDSADIPQETLYQSPQKSLSIPQDTLYKAPLVAQSPQGSAGIPQETLYQSPQRSLSIPQDTLYQAPLVAQSPQRSESVPQETLTKAIPVRQIKPSKRRLTIGIKEREKIFGDLPPTRNVVKSIPAKRDIGRVAQPFVRKAALNRKNVVKAKPFNRRDSVSEETMKKILWGNGNKK